MLTHYIRMLLRKQPLFTAINVAGLVIGTAACLLILKYVQYERAYDGQSPYAGDIWRVFNQTMNGNTVVTEDANSHSAVGPTLSAEVPEVVDFARLYNGGNGDMTILMDGKPFEVAHFYCTDQGFLRMFPQKVLQGNLATALEHPGGAVLTAGTALKIFGTTAVLGRSFRLPYGMCAGLYTVSAVVQDPPENTHLKFDLLTAFANRYANGHRDNFESYWEYTYLQLAPGADPARVRQRLAAINDQFLKKEGIRLDIQPFRDIHLHSNLTYEIEPNGSARTVQFMGLLALFILGIALINYINLTTALAHERGREVGVRKAIGASRGALIRQFLMESLVLCLLAFACSALLVQLCLPSFSQLIGRPLAAPAGSSNLQFWLASGSIFVGMALLAGMYPALLLSGFSPAQALRGRVAGGGGNLRRALVVLQFACSTALVFSVFVVGKQVHFLKNHDLGIQLDQLVAFKAQTGEGRNDSLAARRMAIFKQACAQIGTLKGLAASDVAPGLSLNSVSGSNRPLHWVKKADFVKASSYFVNTDEAFFDLYGVKILAGQPRFYEDRERRYSHVAINRAMLETLGFPDAQSAIGEQLAYEHAENDFKTTITAVVDNFHIESLKTPPKPTLYYCFPPEELRYLTVKIDAGAVEKTLAQLQQRWADIFPEQPFRYWFLDEHFAAQYRTETQLSRLFGLFAGLAIFISCLGLFGLVAYHTERRRKEIGVRKVLGASVTGITRLLAADFMKLVVIAIVLAAPFAYWSMQQWLSGFAYRIELRWWMFGAAGVGAAAVAILTIGLQSIKAALSNPVNSLRNE